MSPRSIDVIHFFISSILAIVSVVLFNRGVIDSGVLVIVVLAISFSALAISIWRSNKNYQTRDSEK